MIKRAPMKRLIKGIAGELFDTPYRFKRKALDAIQEAAESELQQLMRKSVAIAVNGKSKTLMAKDIQCALMVMER
jgi:histone H3/H4